MSIIDKQNKGRVTLPAQAGMENEVLMLAEKWGADAVRDSDGTRLSAEIIKMGYEVYTTLCLIRECSDWAKSHRDHLQQMYLMSKPQTAASNIIEIDLMKYYFKEQFEIDTIHDPKKWWEVIDRTTGQVLDDSLWDFVPELGCVIIRQAEKWHVYTVSFLVYQVWEPVSMYNHLTNGWKEEHKMPVDPRHPETRRHLTRFLDKWLEEHKHTDIVRFTTFFYNFDLIYNEKGKEKQVDWLGYLSCISPLALKEFEKDRGYRLKPEDIVDQGYFNTSFRIPTSKYLDWMDFQQKFVTGFAKDCVEHVHKSGKKAIMFLGDQWVGTEPYGRYFHQINLDAVVGSVNDGISLRILADIPVKATEARFMPYFFPDVFCPEGNPVKESQDVWVKARRAILRKAVDRIGYGGYLSLAVQFPDFIDHVACICDEFRQIHENAKGTSPYSAPFKVAILNYWGKLRSWQALDVGYPYCTHIGWIECLSGMSYNIEFLSFDDIKRNGIPPNVGIIINGGSAGTSWSGGECWIDEKVIASIREWVYNGGGFIGIGEPTAYEYQGGFFQLSDVLGVQKEIGYSVNTNKYKLPVLENHFILEDQHNPVDFGKSTDFIYPSSAETNVLVMKDGSCALSTNIFGRGRSIYVAGLHFNFENVRLLSRAIYWAAGKENDMTKWFSSNLQTECAAYLATGNLVVINNSKESQETIVYDGEGRILEVNLKPFESKWFNTTMFQ